MKFTNHALGADDFSVLIEEHTFYVDKTQFIKEWWDKKSKVTLITRPRRFGEVEDIYNPWSIINFLARESIPPTGQIPAATDWSAGLSKTVTKT